MEKTAYRLSEIIDAMTAIQTMSNPDFCAWMNHLQYELKLQTSAAKRDNAFDAYNQYRESWLVTFTQSEESRYYNQALELLKEWFRHDHAFRRLNAGIWKEGHEEFKRCCGAMKNQARPSLSIPGDDDIGLEGGHDHE